MEGVFTAFRDTVKGYTHHFWGLPILESQNPRPITTTLSFCIGLQWLASNHDKSLADRPSWSWVARNGCVLYDMPVPAALHGGVSITVVRHDGQPEDLAYFAHAHRGYKEYRLWIELKTWVGPCTYLTPGIETDCKDRGLRASDVAVYIGMRYDDGKYTSFEIAEEADHGSFRGVGLAKHDRGNKTRYSYLSGPEERQWQGKIQ